MKILLLILAVLMTPLILCGQDSLLFKIVCSREGVSLDGNTVTPGQDVYSNSKKLEVPSGRYVGVLTADGNGYLFDHSVEVDSVRSFVLKELKKSIVRKAQLAGAIQRSTPWPFQIVPDVTPQYSWIAGDSLVLLWIDNRHYWGRSGSRPPYFIQTKNIFDELLKTDTVRNNWIVLDIKSIMRNEAAFLLDVNVPNTGKSGTASSRMILIKKQMANEIATLQYDLDRVPMNDPEAEIIRMVIYELRSLLYDNFFLEYKWIRDKKQAGTTAAKNYIINQTKKNSLDSFGFSK